MKLTRASFLFALILPLVPTLPAQEIDGSDLRAEVRDREARLNRLSTEDQLKLRAAQQKAAEDPEVQAAMEKRNQAIREFRAVVRASMLKSDPSIAPLLEKVAIPDPPAKKSP